MNGDSLNSVIESVQDLTDSRKDCADGAATKTALVVSCSMSDCSREPLWPVNATWNVVGVQTLGNQIRNQSDSRAVLDSNIERVRLQYDIAAVLVVGHTQCVVLEDAYERWVTPDVELPAGIEARLEPLCSLVGDGFEEGVLIDSMPRRTIQYRLAEYNVRRQVIVLGQTLPSSVTVAGYVYDQDGAYSSFLDKRYLVAVDSATEPTTIRGRLPEDSLVQVASLLT